MTAQDLLLQALPAIYRLERTASSTPAGCWRCRCAPIPAVRSRMAGWPTGTCFMSGRAGRTIRPPPPPKRPAGRTRGDARSWRCAGADAGGHVRGFLGRHPEEASALHERAIALNPNLALAWCFSGLSHFYLGRHEEALRRINRRCRLSPSDPHGFFFDMALIMPHLMRGDYASAVEARAAGDRDQSVVFLRLQRLSCRAWADGPAARGSGGAGPAAGAGARIFGAARRCAGRRSSGRRTSPATPRVCGAPGLREDRRPCCTAASR